MREHFLERLVKKARGISLPGRFVVDNQLLGQPWWWLFTAETLVNLCGVFEVEIEQTWNHKRSGQPHITGATVLARIRSWTRSE